MQKKERYYQTYMEHHAISRRRLLGVLWTSAMKSAEKDRLHTVARPPFAVEESLFLYLCSGCGACVSQCELGLISIVQGKAQLDIEHIACNFCQRCLTHCPSNALNKTMLADTLLRPKMTSNCITPSCQHCITICPQQALSVDEDQVIQFDDSLCNGCGECKVTCFAQAITLALK